MPSYEPITSSVSNMGRISYIHDYFLRRIDYHIILRCLLVVTSAV